MTISRITETKRGRFALFDEEDAFLFSVDGETLHHHHIREGCALDAAALASLRADSDERRAKDKALRLLAVRDHASQELYEKLCRDFDAHTAAAAVAAMDRLGLLDDEAFARRYAQQLAAQNKSRRQIVEKLTQRGIDRGLAEQAADECAEACEGACLALVRKSYRSKLAAGGREKVLAALARRGFSYGEARDAVECVLNELEKEPEYGGMV